MRRRGIGASDIAELLGISPYEGASPVRLYAEKTGLLDDGPDEETLEQRVGHALEGPLVALYCEVTGEVARTSGDFVESCAREDLPWARCNLDGRVVDKPIGLEIKVVGIGMAREWDLDADDGIPHYVRVQCVWQMYVADLEAVHVIALVAGASGFRVFYIQRDRELEAAVLEAAGRFWSGVMSRTMPTLDASAACKALLEKLYPSPPEDVELEAPEELVAVGDRRVRMFDLEGKAKEAKEVANNVIREAMGQAGATVMRAPTWKAIYRTDKNGARTLKVTPQGDAKKPRMAKRKLDAKSPPLPEGAFDTAQHGDELAVLEDAF